MRIARTEVVSASNFGANQAAMDSGLDLEKIWLHPGHPGPAGYNRDDHQSMNGVAVPMNEDFVLPDGTLMPFPGQGPAKHTINCRCQVAFQPRGGGIVAQELGEVDRQRIFGSETGRTIPDERFIPDLLKKDSVYMQGGVVNLDPAIFRMVDPNKPIKLEVTKGKGCYYRNGRVVISEDIRSANSLYHKESVIYHEYGHAIAEQRGLVFGDEKMLALYKKGQKYFSQKQRIFYHELAYDTSVGKYYHRQGKYYISSKGKVVEERLKGIKSKLTKIHTRNPEYLKRLGINYYDVIEQIGGLMDTLMSINKNLGYGHSKKYFSDPVMRYHEFMAHAFENRFAGNPIFKKYAPELYNDMIEFIKTLE
jgi:hypothetical protein